MKKGQTEKLQAAVKSGVKTLISMPTADIFCSVVIAWVFMCALTGSIFESGSINHVKDTSLPLSIFIFAVLFAVSVVCTAKYKLRFRIGVALALIALFAVMAYDGI